MASEQKFKVLSALGTGCRVVGWILGFVALVAGIALVVTASGWREILTGGGVFLGCLVGGLLLVAQGQLIKAILSIEKNTRP